MTNCSKSKQTFDLGTILVDCVLQKMHPTHGRGWDFSCLFEWLGEDWGDIQYMLLLMFYFADYFFLFQNRKTIPPFFSNCVISFWLLGLGSVTPLTIMMPIHMAWGYMEASGQNSFQASFSCFNIFPGSVCSCEATSQQSRGKCFSQHIHSDANDKGLQNSNNNSSIAGIFQSWQV